MSVLMTSADRRGGWQKTVARPVIAANRSQKDYSSRLRIRRELKPRETLLRNGAQSPACLDGTGCEMGSPALVERTDYREARRAAVPVVDPPQGKALGSADRRTGAARRFGQAPSQHEGSAGPLDMRSARAKKSAWWTANRLGTPREGPSAQSSSMSYTPAGMEAIGRHGRETGVSRSPRRAATGEGRSWAH